MLPGRLESGFNLKICKNISKQNVSRQKINMFHNLSRKVMNVNQFWNNNEHMILFQIQSKKEVSMKQIWNNSLKVSIFQIQNQILQYMQSILEIAIHVKFINSL